MKNNKKKTTPKDIKEANLKMLATELEFVLLRIKLEMGYAPERSSVKVVEELLKQFPRSNRDPNLSMCQLDLDEVAQDMSLNEAFAGLMTTYRRNAILGALDEAPLISPEGIEETVKFIAELEEREQKLVKLARMVNSSGGES